MKQDWEETMPHVTIQNHVVPLSLSYFCVFLCIFLLHLCMKKTLKKKVQWVKRLSFFHFFIKIPLLLNVGLRSRQSMLVAKKVKRVYGLVFYRFLSMNHGTSLLVATMADVGIDRLGLRAPPTIQVTQHSSTSGASKIL